MAEHCGSNLLSYATPVSYSGGDPDSPRCSPSSTSTADDDNRRLKRKVAGLTRYTEQLERHILRIHNLWQKESNEKMRIEKIALDIARGAADFNQQIKRPRVQDIFPGAVPSVPAPRSQDNQAPAHTTHMVQQRDVERRQRLLVGEHQSETNQELGRKIRAAASSDSSAPSEPSIPHSSLENLVCEPGWGEETTELDKEFVSGSGTVMGGLEHHPHHQASWVHPPLMHGHQLLLDH